MKRFSMIAAAGLLIGTGALAAPGDLEHNVGQGLGTLIFQGQEGLIQQVLAATTNGICGNQTFAITSGTLGARQAESIVQNENVHRFVAENMDNLARDIATGGGESLATLATLLNVPKGEQGAFANDLRTNFDRIYSDESVTSVEVVNAIAKLRS